MRRANHSGGQERERDDDPGAAVDAAVGEDGAVVVELELAAHEAVGELAGLDGERVDVAATCSLSSSYPRRKTTSNTPLPDPSGGQ